MSLQTNGVGALKARFFLLFIFKPMGGGYSPRLLKPIAEGDKNGTIWEMEEGQTKFTEYFSLARIWLILLTNLRYNLLKLGHWNSWSRNKWCLSKKRSSDNCA